MTRLSLALLLLVSLLWGCGGGGGGTPTPTGKTLTGRILNVVTTSAPNPPAQIQVGTKTALTSSADGSFSIEVPVGTTSVIVDSRSAFGVFTFTIPSVTDATDIGDLYIGPEKVGVSGKVIDSTTDLPIAGATVKFGGRSGTTNGSGIYSIADVAYSSASPAGFQGIVGSSTATGYFANSFSPNGTAPSGGVVSFDDVLLVPASDPNPPPAPFNLYGKVGPTALAAGSSVTLFSGATPVAHTTSGSDGFFYLWAATGTYSLKVENGAHSKTIPAVNLTSGVTLREDVTLP